MLTTKLLSYLRRLYALLPSWQSVTLDERDGPIHVAIPRSLQLWNFTAKPRIPMPQSTVTNQLLGILQSTLRNWKIWQEWLQWEQWRKWQEKSCCGICQTQRNTYLRGWQRATLTKSMFWNKKTFSNLVIQFQNRLATDLSQREESLPLPASTNIGRRIMEILWQAFQAKISVHYVMLSQTSIATIYPMISFSTKSQMKSKLEEMPQTP